MKKGFTLAEVLITLSIIGVLAALTIPQVIKNLNNYAFLKAQTISLAKITEATKQMKSNDVLDGYLTTDTFADEFQKYIKVSKRCTSANLNQCFTPTINLAHGDKVTTSSLITGAKLGQATFTTSTVGLDLINGTSIIFAIYPNCTRIDPLDNTTDTTACLALVYDTNGFSPPNQIGKDIALSHATVSACSGNDVSGLCVSSAPTPFTYYGTYNISGTNYNNYWAGAKKACTDLGKRLPTSAELTTMYNNRAQMPNFSTDAFWYWADTEYDCSGPYCAEGRYSGMSGVNGGFYTSKTNSGIAALCVK